MRKFLAALGVALICLLSCVATPAHAAEDAVKQLAASFDIQPDGSIKVRHELQWHFAETGRHGIEFGIATRENWTADPTQDVVYEVSDVTVDSPSGAPDQFTSRTIDHDSASALSLRIGDPNQTIDGTDATYVITYTLRGALRTFEQGPEFHWDITSYNYPPIEAFTVDVKAPEGRVVGRCLVADRECDVADDGSRTTLSGTGVARGEVLTTAVRLAEGSVTNAEPILVPKRISETRVDSLTGTVTVGRDGVAHVEQTLALRFPEKRGHSVELRFPTRLPWADGEDQHFRISGLTVTDASGTALVTTDATPDWEKRGTSSFMTQVVTGVAPGDVETLTIRYDVAGAAYVHDGKARFVWPVQPTDLEVEALDLRWDFPGEVLTAGCAFRGVGNYTNECTRDLTHEGTGMAWRTTGDHVADTGLAAVAELPADALDGVQPILEMSPGRRQTLDFVTGGGMTLAALAASFAGARGLLRLSRRDRRWADVPPGLTGGEQAVATWSKHPVPVQFNSPDIGFPLAGLLLDGRFRTSHTAAVLTQMAVDDLLVLQSKPLSVARRNGAQEPPDQPRHALFGLARPKLGKPLIPAAIRSMNNAIISAQTKSSRDKALFMAPTEFNKFKRKRGMLVAGLGLLAMVVFLVVGTALRLSGPLLAFPIIALVIGTMVGLATASGDRRPPLQPDGSALLDQVRGFRTYIATAEAGQLNFEADQDIYRRYLPWAVLFGLTDRWTKVCQELAAAGTIPPLDTSFWVGSDSPMTIASALDSFSSSLRTAPNTLSRPGGSSSSGSSSSSSGSSGSSSGFSSGSSGGSGGGGTSASSW